MQRMQVRRPERATPDRKRHADRQLQCLSKNERAEAALRLGCPAVFQELQVERLLPSQAGIQRLPGLLHLVEFHDPVPVIAHREAAICVRSFSLMRLSLVATLVSLMPSTSAISM